MSQTGQTGQRSRGGRQGNVFPIRLRPDERAELEALCAADHGPRHLGPWLVWKALQGPAEPAAAAPPAAASPMDARDGAWLVDAPPPRPAGALGPGVQADAVALDSWEGEGGAIGDRAGITPAPGLELVLPAQPESEPAGVGITAPRAVIPGLAASAGNTRARPHRGFKEPDEGLCERLSEALSALRECKPGLREAVVQLIETSGFWGDPPGYPPIEERVILDLCAGSGSWSEPYRRAGYPVRRVTLPADDVRTFIVKGEVWGVLAAPPCTEFSLAKNGQPRDFVEGMACVNACLRIVMLARPRWWALENPVGLLGRWLGTPRDVFEPFHFGDAWSKRTALWGDFNRPRRGVHVQPIDGGGPICSECHPDNPRVCSRADHRARTPAGFAQAFFEVNP